MGTEKKADAPDRRTFVSTVSLVAMGGGLAAAYGTFGAFAGRFLYPTREPETRWFFAARLADMAAGDTMSFETPDGSTISIARRSDGETAEDFVALSSTCPHLGCRVDWRAKEKDYFCPCHNGVFDTTGKAVSGPPADSGQNLLEYPLRVEAGLLLIGIKGHA